MQFGAGVKLSAYVADACLVGFEAGFAQHGHAFEREAELLHFARVDTGHRHFRDDAFEVAYFGQFLFARFAEGGLAEEIFHAVLPRGDVLYLSQGKSSQR